MCVCSRAVLALHNFPVPSDERHVMSCQKKNLYLSMEKQYFHRIDPEMTIAKTYVAKILTSAAMHIGQE